MKKYIAIALLMVLGTVYPAYARWSVGTAGGGAAAAGGAGYATPAHVQSNSGYSAGPATLGSNSTTGNTLVACVSGISTLASTTLSGGGVTTWNAGTMYNETNSYVRCFYGYVTGGTSVSVTISSGPNDPGWSIYEISGVASTDALDGQNGLGSATLFNTTWSSGTVTTGQTHCALIGYWGSGNTLPGNFAWGAGWGNTTLQNSHYHGSAFRAVTEQGDYAASGTTTTADSAGTAVILSLKAAEL
jgi:hypothetical protein